MKTENIKTYSIVFLIAFIAGMLSIAKCEHDKLKAEQADSNAKVESLMRDIAVEQGIAKTAKAEIRIVQRSKDSVFSVLERIKEREKSRPRIADIQPKKTAWVKDETTPEDDSSKYVSEVDYEEVKVPCIDIQKSLDSALKASDDLRRCDSTERLIQAKKDTSNTVIQGSLMGVIEEKEKDNQRLRKKFKVAKIFAYIGTGIGVVGTIIVATLAASR